MTFIELLSARKARLQRRRVAAHGPGSKAMEDWILGRTSRMHGSVHIVADRTRWFNVWSAYPRGVSSRAASKAWSAAAVFEGLVPYASAIELQGAPRFGERRAAENCSWTYAWGARTCM